MKEIEEKVKYFLDRDYFGIGGAGIHKVRKTNKIIALGIGTVILIILFFIILNLSTNYHKLDDLDDYVDDFNENKNYTNFDKINVGIKIMPSYNLEKNILFMRHSKDPEKTLLENSQSIASSFDLTTTYFRTNQTRKVFPKFSFTKGNVPLGNSINMCVAVHWGYLERGKHVEIMKDVLGFPQCGTTLSEKFIWNEDDTKYGFDIPAWVQTMNEADCNEEDCADYCQSKYNGAYVKGVNKNICYSYEVLDSICLVIRYDPFTEDYYFQGGCLPDGKIYKMTPATYGEVINFSNIKIEIRDFSDPLVQAGEFTEYKFDFGGFWRYVAYLLDFILIVALALLGYTAYDIYITRKKYKNIDGDLIRSEGMPGGNQGLNL